MNVPPSPVPASRATLSHKGRGGIGKILATFILLTLVACDDRANMRRDAHLKPYEPQAFFEDGQSARPLVEGVVATGHLDADAAFYQGKRGGQVVDRVPFPVTMETLIRGRERYNIDCAMCHGRDGYGEGMVVQRGFPKPQSFHTDALRRAPDGHLFDVITNGFGRMQPLGFNVTPADRWAIVAYIRALQLSQNPPPPPPEAAAIEQSPPTEGEKR